MLKYHPDKNQHENIEEKFREMVEAYGLLQNQDSMNKFKDYF